jgi:hypothetical protein
MLWRVVVASSTDHESWQGCRVLTAFDGVPESRTLLVEAEEGAIRAVAKADGIRHVGKAEDGIYIDSATQTTWDVIADQVTLLGYVPP